MWRQKIIQHNYSANFNIYKIITKLLSRIILQWWIDKKNYRSIYFKHAINKVFVYEYTIYSFHRKKFDIMFAQNLASV